MKRFYAAATARADGTVYLDGRPVRTPARALLCLPTRALADAIAAEWNEQGETIAPASMPLTGLANAAIDRIAPEPDRFAVQLAAFGETDLLAYRAEGPDELVARERASWDPLIAWAERRFDLHIVCASGIMHQPQAPETIERLGQVVRAYGPFELAALSPLVTIAGSLLIALAVAEGAITADAAFAAAQLDEDWQAERWGVDPLAEGARRGREASFLAAARFLTLLAPSGSRPAGSISSSACA